MAAETPEKKRGVLEWVAEHFAAVVTLTAAIAYVVLRLAFVEFYRAFGVTPEDVGYDYATVLTTTLPGVGLLLLPLAAFLVVAFGTNAAKRLGSEAGWYDPADRADVAHARRLRRVGILALAVVLPLYVVLALVLIMAPRIDQAAERARSGTEVEGIRVLFAPIFPWTVNRAAVRPVTKDAKTLEPEIVSSCLMYLGLGGTTHTLYDVDRRQVVRLPVASFSVRLGAFAPGCRRPPKASRTPRK